MIELQAISKTFNAAGGVVNALDGVDLRLQSGEGVVLRGPSGSGKSTLLHVLGCMLRPTSGVIDLQGTNPWALSPSGRAAARRADIGFVFQSGHLLPWLTLQSNVQVAGATAQEASDLLDRVGLADRAQHLPGQVSGGERQRAAVARALVGSPTLILADEPTGTLDTDNAGAVLGLLEQARQGGTAIVLATHADAVPSAAWRTIQLEHGRMVEA